MTDDHQNHGSSGGQYNEGSLTLTGSVAMGTGVMIGAGIFALTGQVAELAGALFPLAFVAAVAVVAFSAYSYVKVCNEYLSAGGIAMILKKAYGPGVVTAGCSLLMYFSMVINESLVARALVPGRRLQGGPGDRTASTQRRIPGGIRGEVRAPQEVSAVHRRRRAVPPHVAGRARTEGR